MRTLSAHKSMMLGKWFIADDKGNPVARITDNEERPETTAKLMAAAPEMFVALLSLEESRFLISNETWKLAEAAIQKVRGTAS